MPEHTPAPTPHRAVYGFGFFFLFKTLLFLYLFWAFVPDEILEQKLGLTYLPDKYFALYLPILVMMALMFFAFLIYPAINLSITANIDSEHTIRDKYTIRRCQFMDGRNRHCDRKINYDQSLGWAVPKYCDLHETKLSKTTNDDSMMIDDDYKIEDYCDCLDKESCWLAKNENHINVLHARKTVPSVCDLDVSDVCYELFG